RQRLAAHLRVQGMRRVVIPSADDRLDRHLTSLRFAIGRERTRLLNRIKGLLRRHNLEQDCPTKGIQTQQARRWLAKLSLNALERLELDQLLPRWKTLEPQGAGVGATIR